MAFEPFEHKLTEESQEDSRLDSLRDLHSVDDHSQLNCQLQEKQVE